MPATLIKGKPIADRIRAEVAEEVASIGHIGLVTVLVGDDPASEVYIRLKHKAAVEAGFDAQDLRLPAETSEEELLAKVAELDASDDVDAILVQLPLPDHIDEAKVIRALEPAKDVDGFHPFNAGQLYLGRPTLVPATPLGVLAMLHEHRIELDGARAVVIGRSDIVGKPMALMLLHANATVTICHSRTADLPAVAATADILVVAIGRAGFVTREFVKPGATVIDVGMNTLRDAATVEAWFPAESPRRAEFAKKGALLVGDVDPRVASVAGALTPVPRGVGPLTIAMLMNNTVVAAESRVQR
jgi:methylenetetrahydrofolate dehydrogenase (NADP+)/methenyltetrahydrofolate cyclohydrolase